METCPVGQKVKQKRGTGRKTSKTSPLSQEGAPLFSQQGYEGCVTCLNFRSDAR